MKIPALLWHYTDCAGMLGILQSNSLRLGDTKYLNDRTELSFARKIAREYLATLAASESDKFLRSVATLVSLSRSEETIYAASLSAVADSLSQWQRYGADGYGYCIGFATTTLLAHVRIKERPVELRCILYNTQRQQSAIRTIVSRFMRDEPRLIRDLEVKNNEWQHLRPVALAIRIEEVIARIKNPFFEDEREWRFVFPLKKNEQDGFVEFCSRGPYVKPFVKATSASKEGRLPFQRIICGPRLDTSVAIEPLRHLLDTLGLSEVQVQQSSLAEVWR